jgi:hypothetical protein
MNNLGVEKILVVKEQTLIQLFLMEFGIDLNKFLEQNV